MVCSEPGTISDGYTTSTKSRYGNHEAVGYICHQGYSLVGSPIITCNGSHWSTLPEFWFWLLIGLGLLLTIAIITALCLYCTKRHRYRRRNRVRALNSDDDEQFGCCGGCCDYGGSCDVCGCIDYYGCCALYGCCGYLGVCSWFFGCCRCCREPLESHRKRMDVTGNVFYINHQNVTPRISTRWEELPKRGRLSKKTAMRLKKKRQRMLENRDYVSERVENPLNDETYGKVRRSAKDLDIWLPHSNPVRSINTSTK
ncbi:Hypothetical predicted protein [Mytilus galloprovincialis]|uniref:Sushi domain-containing protein n=1 Tax=Mytilus galloprovincialis TaxID=29158 RepID=A0A8B6C8D9_MYTGA|nr:Hypothetical predicted protein [Mytilus galloprovincialis]